MTRFFWACGAAVALVSCVFADNRIEKGIIPFKPVGDQKEVPQRYRLAEHKFPYELEFYRRLPENKIELYKLRFPSPVTSPYPENNTVHAEYYRPVIQGKMPGVIVLHITGGDQSLSRTISTILAKNGIAALFVQMAYYGPRRPAGKRVRLLSADYNHTMAAVRQTVLDLRRAAAWLESRPEIDRQRLGILGTSLGSFMAALTAEMEPRLKRVVVLLGGGGFVEAYYDDPRFELIKVSLQALGFSKADLIKLIAPADPITCAANLKDRKLLIIAGKKDEIVPPKMAEALWQAAGKQKIVWYDCGHYTAILYLVPAMKHIVNHLKAP
ncbi:MAG: hypothetical protein KatS3mg105_4593 [Gemmatales bacterium]|nr:MAG: hypothetical protein KatS3mg105_4593 [Gemmatales bacterium]